MENSKIQWTDHTFNPWMGCTKVSQACKFCYAEIFAERYNMVNWGEKGARRKTVASSWQKPITYNWSAKRNNTRYKVFCASLADIFDDHVSIKQEWRDEFWNLVRKTPYLDWQLLTKRPENFKKFLPADWGYGYKNVWLGVSAETQLNYDERAKILSNTSAYIRFMSMEPLLTPIRLNHEYRNIEWIIIGGESGTQAGIRKLDLTHVKHTIDQVKTERLFVKQLGNKLSRVLNLKNRTGSDFEELPDHLSWLNRREFPEI